MVFYLPQTTCVPSSKRNIQNREHLTRRSDGEIEWKLSRYRPPNRDKLKREYRQPWNERGTLTNKDTSYVGKNLTLVL